MKNIIFIAAFFLTSISAIAQNESPLFCKDGNKTVRIEFETGFSYLELNKPTKLKIYVENIDLKKSAISGRGIRPLGNSRKDEFFLGCVTVDEEGVIDGNFEIIFSYSPIEGGERGVCRFLIPVTQP